MFSIIMILINVVISTYTYIPNSNGNLDGWVIYNAQMSQIQNCGNTDILGGINSFNENTIISRSISDLDPHYQIKLDFWIWTIDSSSITDLEVQFDFDDYNMAISSQLLERNNYCGQASINEEKKKISFKSEHTKQIVNVSAKFKYNIQQIIQWGVEKMELNLFQCYQGCSFCSGPEKFDCLNWHNRIYYFANNLFTNLINISNEIDEFSQYFECYKCERSIIIDFVLTDQSNQVELKRKDFINEELILEVYNNGTMLISLIREYGVAEFNFRCYCKMGDLEQQVEIQYELKYYVLGIIQPFLPGCLNNIGTECVQCQQGWKFNSLEKVCSPDCGNGSIEGDEECDDGNSIMYDGCYQCKLQCSEDCKICKYGNCKECQEGLQLDETIKKCLPICGDGLISPYSSEICDDGNQEQDDGCFNCQLECNAYCQKCIFVACVQCQIGFNLVNNNCNPVCGDKIVLPQFEECDDGNDEDNDSCYECKKVCQSGCDICENGVCLVNCLEKHGEGFYYIDGSCKSLCGDNIIAGQEQCDDGSTQQPSVINQQGQIIKHECGDYILQNKEICDDGNNDLFDGCYECRIEYNWKCQQIEEVTKCKYLYPTTFTPIFLNITNNKQYVLLKFSCKIQLDYGYNLTEIMKLSVMDDQVQYNLTFLDKNEPIENQFEEVYYLLQIEVYEMINFKPILNIEFNNISIYNEDEQYLKRFDYQLNLEIPQYLGSKQVQQSKNIKGLNQYILYGLIGIAGVGLILGNPKILTEILDTLQHISYLKYINLQFPQNLLIYFQISDLISMSLLFDFIQFETFQDYLIPQIETFPDFGKFFIYQQNSDLLTNLNTQIIQLLCFVLLYLTQKLLEKLFYSNTFQRKFILLIAHLSSKFNEKIILGLSKSFFKISQQLIRCTKYISASHFIINIMKINAWDVFFKCFIFLRSNEDFHSFRSLISNIIVYFIICSYGFLIINQIQYYKKVLKQQQKNQIIEQNYETLNLLRQIIYLFILIYFQESQIIQTSLLFANSIISIVLIINSRKIQAFQIFVSMIFQEGVISLFILSSLIYSKEFQSSVSMPIQIIIGLVQMIFLSSVIIFQFLRLSINSIIALSNQFKKKSPQIEKIQLF